MSGFWEVAGTWPVRAILIGGVLLIAGRVLMLFAKQPARREVIGVAAVFASLIVIPLAAFPGWLPITVSANQEQVEVVATTQPASIPETLVVPGSRPEPNFVMNTDVESREAIDQQTDSPTQTPVVIDQPRTQSATVAVVPSIQNVDWLKAAYALVVIAFLAKLFVGHWGLSRLWRSAQSPPQWLEMLFRDLAGSTCARAKLRVSNRAIGPVCFGVLRPRVLVPITFISNRDHDAIRAVLVHELSHLSRRDPLAGWLIGIARAIHFVWPWLSGLRREVRLAQEQIADAAAARSANGPVDYAELLIRMSRTRPAPLGAAGVRGSNSELFRRITMLLQKNEQIETRCPRSWKVLIGGCLAAFAIAAAGLYIQPRESLAADPKDAPKLAPKVDPIKQLIEKLKKDAGDDPDKAKQIEELEKSLKAKPAPDLTPIPVPNIAPPQIFDELPEDELLRELLQGQGQLMKQLEQMLGQLQGGNQGGLGLAFGPDGLLRPARSAGGARLGIRVEKPNEVLATQLDLPNGQGLVCLDVPADSNASKVGIKPHDILLEVAGKPVPNDVQSFVDALKAIKPDTAIDIVLLRKGRKETLKGVKLPEAKEVAADVPALVFPKLELPRGFPMQIEAPALPSLPERPKVGAVVGPGETVRVEQVNDAFTIFYAKNGVKVTIAGTKDGGTAKAESIEVDDNGKTTKAESIDKLPKEYQELAKSAMKAIR